MLSVSWQQLAQSQTCWSQDGAAWGVPAGGQGSASLDGRSSDTGQGCPVIGPSAGEAHGAAAADQQGLTSVRSGVSAPLTPGRCWEASWQRLAQHAGPPLASSKSSKAGEAPIAASGRTIPAKAGGKGSAPAWRRHCKVRLGP